MASRRGRIEFLTVEKKRVFTEYSDDTQDALVKHSFDYDIDEALDLQKKLVLELKEFQKLFDNTHIPSISGARIDFARMYERRRRQLWASLIGSFQVLALRAIYFEKDSAAMKKISDVLMEIAIPDDVPVSEKMLELMIEVSEEKTMDVEGEDELFS